MRKTSLAVLIPVVAGCATLTQHKFDERYGTPDPARYDTPTAPKGDAPSYREHVQPILERRRVMCHGCHDAPCQTKLGAWEGIARGGSTERVDDGGRVTEAAPSQLFVDAQSASEWRKHGAGRAGAQTANESHPPSRRVRPEQRPPGAGDEGWAGPWRKTPLGQNPAERRAAMTWAQRLNRVFGIDLQTCSVCGGALRIIACIEDPASMTYW